MKKVMASVLVVVMLLGLCACGGRRRAEKEALDNYNKAMESYNDLLGSLK